MKKKIDDLTVAEIRKHICDKMYKRYYGCFNNYEDKCRFYDMDDYCCRIMYDSSKNIEIEVEDEDNAKTKHRENQA